MFYDTVAALDPEAGFHKGFLRFPQQRGELAAFREENGLAAACTPSLRESLLGAERRPSIGFAGGRRRKRDAARPDGRQAFLGHLENGSAVRAAHRGTSSSQASALRPNQDAPRFVKPAR